MKYYCLDRDSCGFSKKLTEEEFNNTNFSEPFKNCIKCNYYMIIVPDEFQIESNEVALQKAISTLYKIYESKK